MPLALQESYAVRPVPADKHFVHFAAMNSATTTRLSCESTGLLQAPATTAEAPMKATNLEKPTKRKIADSEKWITRHIATCAIYTYGASDMYVVSFRVELYMNTWVNRELHTEMSNMPGLRRLRHVHKRRAHTPSLPCICQGHDSAKPGNVHLPD